jgi:hypothetical protein
LQELVGEKERIIEQFQDKETYDERQIEQLKKNYRKAVLCEEKLRLRAQYQSGTDNRL